MTERTLPGSEWSKLAGTEAAAIVGRYDPAHTNVVVVEDAAGRVVGCHVLAYMLHAECLWIHPDYRGKSSVARRLWAAVCSVVKKSGAGGFITAATDGKVKALLEHVGAKKMPGDHYVVEVP
jgi:N-acetylglutamate synthase-like GNAT family acetyltransferase